MGVSLHSIAWACRGSRELCRRLDYAVFCAALRAPALFWKGRKARPCQGGRHSAFSANEIAVVALQNQAACSAMTLDGEEGEYLVVPAGNHWIAFSGRMGGGVVNIPTVTELCHQLDLAVTMTEGDPRHSASGSMSATIGNGWSPFGCARHCLRESAGAPAAPRTIQCVVVKPALIVTDDQDARFAGFGCGGQVLGVTDYAVVLRQVAGFPAPALLEPCFEDLVVAADV